MASVVISGDTSGAVTLSAPAVAGTPTLTLPTTTDTLVGKATTDTLTNKTLTTPVISSLSSASATALTLQSAGTTAITVDTSQNVGIGVTPSTWSLGKALEINTVGQGVWATSSAVAVANNWYYNGAYKFAGTGYASRFLSSGQFQSIDVSTASGTAGNNITFATVLGTGYNQTVALQGASQSAGTGISFPATQSASSDANTLDDYEEGTYTPTITFNTTNGNLTYSVQVGRYIKIGQLVYVGGQIVFAQTTASSYFYLNNLPFTSKNVTNFSPSTGCGVENMNGLSGGIYIQVSANSVAAYPYQSQTGTSNIIGAARCNGGSATISWGFTYLSDV